jgi:small subunit ribosomal protein S8
MKMNILTILKKNNYIVNFSTDTENHSFTVELHDVRKTKYIPTLRRISRPGQRIYIAVADIKKSRNGEGIFILSTPK